MENEIDVRVIEPLIADVSGIKEQEGIEITRDTIRDYVEEPLVEACEILYDKNIRTFTTSANLEGQSEGIAGIGIDYDTLSEKNRNIAQNVLGLKPYPSRSGNGEDIMLEIPMKKDSTVREISEKAKDMAQQFVKQKPIWIKGITLEEAEKEWRMGSGPELFTYLQERMYYDSKNKLFYPNEEYYRKIVDYDLE